MDGGKRAGDAPPLVFDEDDYRQRLVAFFLADLSDAPDRRERAGDVYIFRDGQILTIPDLERQVRFAASGDCELPAVRAAEYHLAIAEEVSRLGVLWQRALLVYAGTDTVDLAILIQTAIDALDSALASET